MYVLGAALFENTCPISGSKQDVLPSPTELSKHEVAYYMSLSDMIRFFDLFCKKKCHGVHGSRKSLNVMLNLPKQNFLFNDRENKKTKNIFLLLPNKKSRLLTL